MEQLTDTLQRIDGRGYAAYKDIKGTHTFPQFALIVDHVQADPFAAPSRIRVRVPKAEAGFSKHLTDDPGRCAALCDYLTRMVNDAIRRHVDGRRGVGRSGEMGICAPGQQVLVRNSVCIDADAVEARLTVGLPATGRVVEGRQAALMLLRELPRVVERSLLRENLNGSAIAAHVKSMEDQEALRAWVVEQGHAAFIPDGAHLARRSGVDDRPLADGIAFATPDSLTATMELPRAGKISGMAIPRGVTLIVGGGFHGKSTLLNALQMGVYNHVPGDGRECVATDPTAVKIRAEDGRAVHRVDITPFIDNLPFDRDTRHFSTENASGSTSQAAAIMEALETGARLLLIDEDTSATNFMIRDGRMQQLVHRDKEPITPFLHRVRELYDVHGVSSIIVMGGSGDYFDVADTVIMMDTYVPRDMTEKARELASSDGPAAAFGAAGPPPAMTMSAGRTMTPISAASGRRDVKIGVRGRDQIGYGDHQIDLSQVPQVAEGAQSRAIGRLLHRWATVHANERAPMIDGLKAAIEEAQQTGLDVLCPHPEGNLALPRLAELAAALNRVRRVPVVEVADTEDGAAPSAAARPESAGDRARRGEQWSAQGGDRGGDRERSDRGGDRHPRSGGGQGRYPRDGERDRQHTGRYERNDRSDRPERRDSGTRGRYDRDSGSARDGGYRDNRSRDDRRGGGQDRYQPSGDRDRAGRYDRTDRQDRGAGGGTRGRYDRDSGGARDGGYRDNRSRDDRRGGGQDRYQQSGDRQDRQSRPDHQDRPDRQDRGAGGGSRGRYDRDQGSGGRGSYRDDRNRDDRSGGGQGRYQRDGDRNPRSTGRDDRNDRGTGGGGYRGGDRGRYDRDSGGGRSGGGGYRDNRSSGSQGHYQRDGGRDGDRDRNQGRQPGAGYNRNDRYDRNDRGSGGGNRSRDSRDTGSGGARSGGYRDNRSGGQGRYPRDGDRQGSSRYDRNDRGTGGGHRHDRDRDGGAERTPRRTGGFKDRTGGFKDRAGGGKARVGSQRTPGQTERYSGPSSNPSSGTASTNTPSSGSGPSAGPGSGPSSSPDTPQESD